MYFLYTWSTRALAQGLVGWTFSTDLVYALAQYSIFRHIAKNDSKWGQAGYALGGAIGSVIAIYVTKSVFGK